MGSLHGPALCTLLIGRMVLAGLFAFLAPLALLVLVAAVGVALLTVMPSPTAAAAGGLVSALLFVSVSPLSMTLLLLPAGAIASLPLCILSIPIPLLITVIGQRGGAVVAISLAVMAPLPWSLPFPVLLPFPLFLPLPLLLPPRVVIP